MATLASPLPSISSTGLEERGRWRTVSHREVKKHRPSTNPTSRAIRSETLARSAATLEFRDKGPDHYGSSCCCCIHRQAFQQPSTIPSIKNINVHE